MEWQLVLYPLLTFFAVLALIPVLRGKALRCNFVDAPGGRKQHDEPVPPIGGLIVFSVFMIATLAAGFMLSHYWPLFTALLLILIMGAWDDAFTIRPWVKFLVQFVAAFLIVIPGGAMITTFGDMLGFGEIHLGFMAIPFSVFCTVLLINSINLIDGLDGLAAGKSFVILLWLLMACLAAHAWNHALILLLLMAALWGFLVYNMRHPFRDKACVFLGDAGSMGLGLVLAWFCIRLAQPPIEILKPVAVAWIIALPVIDACGQFIRRMLAGRHPFSPDRGHFHHHFIEAGIPVRYATAAILALGFIFGLIGYGGIRLGVPEYILFAGWLALWAVHMFISLKPQPFIAFLSRFHSVQ